MSNRRSHNNTASPSSSPSSMGVDVPSSMQCNIDGNRGESVNSEKSPISALIQKFSPSSSSFAHRPLVSVGGSVAASSAVDQTVNEKNTVKMSSVAFKSKGDEVDCASAVTSATCPIMAPSDPIVLVRGNSAKVNNKLGVHSHICAEDSVTPSLVVSPSGSPVVLRKGSDSGQLRATLGSAEERNSAGRVNSNGHLVNSPRKMSADFRLNHRDLLNEDNGKHFGLKPARVKNLANKTETFDMLYHKTVEKVSFEWVHWSWWILCDCFNPERG